MFHQDYILHPQNFKRERETSVHSSPQLWQLPIGTEEQNDDAGFGAGERPPGGPLLWPLLGPALSLRARSTSSAPWGVGTGTLQGAISFYNQPAISVAAEEPFVTSHQPQCCLLASQLSSLDYELVTDRTVSCCIYTQSLV